MRHTLAVTLVALVVTGCHARFKKHAPSIDAVRPQTLQVSAPNVQLGFMHNPTDSALGDLVAAGVNLGQTVKSMKLTEDLQRKVDTDQVARAFHEGFAESLGAGPPFGTTTDEGAPTLQVEIVDLGMEVPALGAPGVFNYDLRVRLYLPDGKLVYKNGVHCATGVGSPDPVAAALMVVDNAKALEEMSREEVQAAFDGSARYCGMALTREMRKHAG